MEDQKLTKAQEKKEERLKTTKDAIAEPNGVSGQRLKSFIERIERLSEERQAISEDIRDVYAETKSTGFEPKIIRKIVSLRKQNIEKRREEQELIELYKAALGMSD